MAARAVASVAGAVAVSNSFWARPVRLRLACVRHAESLNNVHEAVSRDCYEKNRSADPSLSNRGARQAEALAGYLADAAASASTGIHPITELVVSPQRRTLETMAPLAASVAGPQLRPRVDVRCFEAGGLYRITPDRGLPEVVHGLTRQQMCAIVPDLDVPDDSVTDDGWFFADGVETDDQCRTRAVAVAQSLKLEAASLRDNKQVVLVTHYDFMCALLDALVERGDGAPPSGDFKNWRHFNTGITVIDITCHGDCIFLMQNHHAHLTHDGELVSGFGI